MRDLIWHGGGNLWGSTVGQAAGRPPIEALEDRRLLTVATGLAIAAAGVPVAPLAVPVAASYDGTVKYKEQAGRPATTAQAFDVAITSAAADGTIHGTLTSPTLGTVPFDGQLSGKKFVVEFDGAVDGYLTGKLSAGGKRVQATLLNVTEGTKAKVKAKADPAAGFVLLPATAPGGESGSADGSGTVATVVGSSGSTSTGGSATGSTPGGSTTGATSGTVAGTGASTTGGLVTTGGVTTANGTTAVTGTTTPRFETLTPGAAATIARDYLAALAAANGGVLPGSSTANGTTGTTGTVGSNGAAVGSNGAAVGSNGAAVGSNGSDGTTVGTNGSNGTTGGTVGSNGSVGTTVGTTTGGTVGAGTGGTGGVTDTGSSTDTTIPSTDVPPTIIVGNDGLF